MTTRYFPHPDYAESQPYAKTILTTHVLHRGFTTGSLLASTFTLSSYTYRHLISRAQPAAFLPTLIRSSARGALSGTLVISAALAARMHDKTEIEWQDRSWRLLGNEGQVLVDDFSIGGAVLAALGAGLVKGWSAGGAMGVVGRAGVGSVAGTVVYLGWRYGVGGGARVVEEEVRREKGVLEEVVKQGKV